MASMLLVSLDGIGDELTIRGCHWEVPLIVPIVSLCITYNPAAIHRKTAEIQGMGSTLKRSPPNFPKSQ
jgi:hypothetical protein